MAWPHNPRLAGSLITLRDQFNRFSPHRNKASDGYLGDAAHQRQGAASDHNPHVVIGGIGVVTAADFTHDPARGMHIGRLTDELQASRDPRIKYVIANALIMSGNGGPSPWVWRRYGGSNPHRSHMHISVYAAAHLADDRRLWNLASLGEDDMFTDTDRQFLDDIKQQLTGSRDPGQFPGWETFVNNTIRLTDLDYLRYIDKRINALLAMSEAQNEALARLTRAVAQRYNLNADALFAGIKATIEHEIGAPT